MTLSEVDYACVVTRRRFYQLIPLPGVGGFHHVLFRVVVSIQETNGNSTTKQFNPYGSLLSFPDPGLFPDRQAVPQSRYDFFATSFPPDLEPRSSKFKVGLYFLCTCSFIDNVILTDCNRQLHPIPPNLVAHHPSSPTVQVCPDFYPPNLCCN